MSSDFQGLSLLKVVQKKRHLCDLKDGIYKNKVSLLSLNSFFSAFRKIQEDKIIQKALNHVVIPLEVLAI